MKNMTLMQHFAELRRRVLWTFLIFACAFGAGWVLAPWVQEFLTAPLLTVWPDGIVVHRIGRRVDDSIFIGNVGGIADCDAGGAVACVGVCGAGTACK